jgi:GxxExxY protein
MHVNEITGQIVDAAIKVHRTLGPGLLESVYEIVLAYELVKRGFTVARQQAIPIVYETMTFDDAFRADLIVNNLVIVELKSIEAIAPVHKKQLLTYLRLSGRHVGLLINFNVELLKDGLTRIVENLQE